MPLQDTEMLSVLVQLQHWQQQKNPAKKKGIWLLCHCLDVFADTASNSAYSRVWFLLVREYLPHVNQASSLLSHAVLGLMKGDRNLHMGMPAPHTSPLTAMYGRHPASRVLAMESTSCPLMPKSQSLIFPFLSRRILEGLISVRERNLNC